MHQRLLAFSHLYGCGKRLQSCAVIGRCDGYPGRQAGDNQCPRHSPERPYTITVHALLPCLSWGRPRGPVKIILIP
ncbi:hypothetical protein PCL1606_15310 [Pseudomonas chlororaphis]|uniref:Uncharacterized protein n=1 Tax=Pseudomonas chlororaphis TaxID=587753 RepID=A0A0D5XW77_9PSED|nr:hypothetical protein PCL1606_15310 [Pseudomonas chlororaphis]